MTRVRLGLQTLLRATIVAMVVLACPALAYGVTVSHDYGDGWQSVTSGRDYGWTATGKLRSYAGPVYFAGNVVYDNAPDKRCGRYTSNTSSSSYVTKGGTCDKRSIPFANADAAKFQICTDEYLWPDDCASWSRTDRF